MGSVSPGLPTRELPHNRNQYYHGSVILRVIWGVNNIHCFDIADRRPTSEISILAGDVSGCEIFDLQSVKRICAEWCLW